LDGQCNLSLQCDRQRIDWLLTSVIVADRELTEFPRFGKLPEALDLYRRFFLSWLAHAPSCKRVAFGCVLTRAAESREAGYRWISNLLPAITLDPKGSSDFSYSINRPRQSTSGIEGLNINRLSKWSVARLRSMRLQQATGEEPLSAPELFACRVELDVNSVPEFPVELSSSQLESLIHELIELGIEIALKGDLP